MKRLVLLGILFLSGCSDDPGVVFGHPYRIVTGFYSGCKGVAERYDFNYRNGGVFRKIMLTHVRCEVNEITFYPGEVLWESPSNLAPLPGPYKVKNKE